jgi:hypothetical protein
MLHRHARLHLKDIRQNRNGNVVALLNRNRIPSVL